METITMDKKSLHFLLRQVFEDKRKHLRCDYCGKRIRNSMSNIGGVFPKSSKSGNKIYTLMCNSILCVCEYTIENRLWNVDDETPKTLNTTSPIISESSGDGLEGRQPENPPTGK